MKNWYSFFILALIFMLPFQAMQAQTPYRIPVVVHVIHSDGTENISDEQIKNGIEILTRNWRKQNPDTVEIVPLFKPIAADMEVEFELAKLDPQGNCTKGINRIRSGLTTTGDHAVKDLIHWPREKYLNIYVTRNAAGLAGHALMPFQADSLPGWDGIVMQGNYFGNIGTSNDLRSVVLSHEVGHYLNLYHIWGGNNVPEFYYLPVGQQANCAVGDSVSDTPQTIGWSSCNLNSVSCDGQQDNVQNFMDYAYCARMFTQGQKQRVHAALNSPIAQRNNLWTPANLNATGLSVDAPLCVADFYTSKRIYCANETVRFYDASYHDPISWNWTTGSGANLSGASPTYVYPASGKYDIGLTVSDGTDSESISRPGYIKVLETAGKPMPFIEGFESWISLNESDWMLECEGAECVELNTQFASGGQKSIWIDNFSGDSGLVYRITSPRLNLAQTPDPVIRFKYAFAQKDTSNTDKLLVKLSKDCGQTWITRRTITATEMATVSNPVSSPFSPQAQDWKEITVTGILSLYQTDNIIVRFEFYSGAGNNLYIDDINMYDLSTQSIKEPGLEEWNIAPNPASDGFFLKSNFQSQQLEIFSADGKLIARHENLGPDAYVPLADLPMGVYQVKLNYNGIIAFRKLVIAGR